MQDFDTIVAENNRYVYSLALRIVGSEVDAEDITQEVFMKLYKSKSSFRGASKISTLLYRMTYNHAVDYMRKRKLPKCELRDNILEDQGEENKSYEEKMLILDDAIAQLSIEERMILTLFYTDNKSVEEISSIISISTANIKTKLHRIRKKLHKIIGEQYYEQ
ncbi:MAG: sigma-70 family RNA polymerase sigma factor [Rikenellaceae bacterium]